MTGPTRTWWCVPLLACLLAGCGDRQGSIDAALMLAEINYPGKLELYDTHLQKDHYDVVLAIKDDPVTRIRFGVDRDPAQCRSGTACEVRLRSAYANGVAAGAKLKALDQALRKCGVTALGIDGRDITPAFTTIIELDLDPVAPQPSLDRLTPCIAAFRQALPPDATLAQHSLALHVLPTEKPGAAPAAPLTFETLLASKRAYEPSYLAHLGPTDKHLASGKLRLNPQYLMGDELRARLLQAARRTLDDDPLGGHVPPVSFLAETQLDPQRLDVIRTYILACSKHEPGKGPCEKDIAVRLRYDFQSQNVSEQAVLRDIRDERGRTNLPELPGR